MNTITPPLTSPEAKPKWQNASDETLPDRITLVVREPIEGTFIKIIKDIPSKEFAPYSMAVWVDKSGIEFGLACGKSIAEQTANLKEGDYCRIVYLGKINLTGGKTFQKYLIQVDPDHVPF